MVLCRFFEEDANPNICTRNLLAEKLGAPVDRITIWFQNQRARGFPAKKMLNQTNFVKKHNLGLDSPTANFSNNSSLANNVDINGSDLSFMNGQSNITDNESSRSADQSTNHSFSHINQTNSGLVSYSSPHLNKLNTIPVAAHSNNNSNSIAFFNQKCLSQSVGQGHPSSSQGQISQGHISTFNKGVEDSLVKKESQDNTCQPLNLCDSSRIFNRISMPSNNLHDISIHGNHFHGNLTQQNGAHGNILGKMKHESQNENNQPLNFSTSSSQMS